eukprot:TRINITY_DN11658_c0_g2_i1.p2 TRINITY_DN11658_c0_g2~~TRINITY_DN11658_c0_g2_i1.p2  ORF type:complete len:104 (-),score=1.92 TRINITY_DN11658_c0_g2_i1:216-527(-)
MKKYLTRNPKCKERRKYGLKKARKAPQYSKRQFKGAMRHRIKVTKPPSYIYFFQRTCSIKSLSPAKSKGDQNFIEHIFILQGKKCVQLSFSNSKICCVQNNID